MDPVLPRLAIDALGFLAAAFTVLAYAQRVAVPLRCFGLGANCCFIAYGALTLAAPVVALHLILLAVNAALLRGALRAGRAPPSPCAGGFAMFPARAPVGPA